MATNKEMEPKEARAMKTGAEEAVTEEVQKEVRKVRPVLNPILRLKSITEPRPIQRTRIVEALLREHLRQRRAIEEGEDIGAAIPVPRVIYMPPLIRTFPVGWMTPEEAGQIVMYEEQQCKQDLEYDEYAWPQGKEAEKFRYPPFRSFAAKSGKVFKDLKPFPKDGTVRQPDSVFDYNPRAKNAQMRRWRRDGVGWYAALSHYLQYVFPDGVETKRIKPDTVSGRILTDDQILYTHRTVVNLSVSGLWGTEYGEKVIAKLAPPEIADLIFRERLHKLEYKSGDEMEDEAFILDKMAKLTALYRILVALPYKSWEEIVRGDKMLPCMMWGEIYPPSPAVGVVSYYRTRTVKRFGLPDEIVEEDGERKPDELLEYTVGQTDRELKALEELIELFKVKRDEFFAWWKEHMGTAVDILLMPHSNPRNALAGIVGGLIWAQLSQLPSFVVPAMEGEIHERYRYLLQVWGKHDGKFFAGYRTKEMDDELIRTAKWLKGSASGKAAENAKRDIKRLRSFPLFYTREDERVQKAVAGEGLIYRVFFPDEDAMREYVYAHHVFGKAREAERELVEIEANTWLKAGKDAWDPGELAVARALLLARHDLVGATANNRIVTYARHVTAHIHHEFGHPSQFFYYLEKSPSAVVKLVAYAAHLDGPSADPLAYSFLAQGQGSKSEAVLVNKLRERFAKPGKKEGEKSFAGWSWDTGEKKEKEAKKGDRDYIVSTTTYRLRQQGGKAAARIVIARYYDADEYARQRKKSKAIGISADGDNGSFDFAELLGHYASASPKRIIVRMSLRKKVETEGGKGKKKGVSKDWEFRIKQPSILEWASDRFLVHAFILAYLAESKAS